MSGGRKGDSNDMLETRPEQKKERTSYTAASWPSVAVMLPSRDFGRGNGRKQAGGKCV